MIIASLMGYDSYHTGINEYVTNVNVGMMSGEYYSYVVD